MPWTEITRSQYQRNGLRYAGDMTDAEWALIARRMPARRHLGRPSLFSLPDVSGGRCRRNFRHTQQFGAISMLGAIPQDGKKSLRLWFGKRVVSLAASPKPTAAVIDSQSAPTTQAGGPRGYDAGKRIYGRERHIVTDTNGLLLAVHVPPANVQDCHGAVPLLERVRCRFPKTATCLCRSNLSRRAASKSALPLWAVDDRDRRASAWRQGLPTVAAVPGRRTHFCLAWQMPAPRQRLRRICRNRSRMDPRCAY
jgi:hypothetical protein